MRNEISISHVASLLKEGMELDFHLNNSFLTSSRRRNAHCVKNISFFKNPILQMESNLKEGFCI
jgi:hypothetical protein